ncbi:MAG: Npt1/Npt2 family nucleotide transporter [Actinomycetota bacterium]
MTTRAGSVNRPARLLGLKPGEGGTVALTVSAAFFSAGGLMIAQSGIDALFFAHYGVSKLPVMYLTLGATMFVASLGVGVLLGRVGRARAFILIPLALALLAVAGRSGLTAGASWLYPAMWIVRGVGDFMQGIFVWGLAGLVTDTRQAKRIFPLIGAGSVVGQILGGVVTKPLASFTGAENLILVWAASFGVVAFLAYRLVVSRARAALRPERARRKRVLADMEEGFKAVRRSPLLRWLAAGSVLFSLLFFSLYLPFSRAATLRYTDPDQLAGFFGVFYAASTAAALLVSLFVTNRVLSRFGVPMAMLVLPVLYVGIFGVLTVKTTFGILAAARFVQIVWMQGGGGSATEAVINTVPADRRDQTRAFIYGGPTQVGTIVAGLIALIGEQAVSPRLLTSVGLAAAIAAVIAMTAVRRTYPRELVVALREGRPHVFGAAPTAGSVFGGGGDAAATSVAVAGLGDDDPRIRRLAAHVLGELESAEASDALRAALRDGDAGVRAAAAGSLARVGDSTSLETLPVLLSDPEVAVRRAALDAIAALDAQHGDVPGGVAPQSTAVLTVRRMMRDADPTVRTAAARIILERGTDAEAVRVVAELSAAPDEATRADAYTALGSARGGPEVYSLARTGLFDAAPIVRAAAVRALAALDADQAADPLIEATADPSAPVRAAVAQALGEIGDGVRDRVVASLFSPDRTRGALEALERIPLDGAADVVRRFAAESVARALEDHRIASALGDGDDRLALLRDSLHERAQRTATDALRAAALLGDRTSISVALENLSVDDPTQRANALEVVETVGDPEIVRPLLALWDTTAGGETAPDWLDRLRNDPDPWIRACADLVAGEREGGTMTKTLTTLTTMERVMFLRKVPLFAELPPQDLEPIAAIAEEYSFADGEMVAEQGAPGDSMHIIVTGEVEVDADGRPLAMRRSGDVIGEMAIITSHPRMATLVAHGSVRVLSIGRRAFESILRERPETSLAVMRVLCERLEDRGHEQEHT